MECEELMAGRLGRTNLDNTSDKLITFAATDVSADTFRKNKHHSTYSRSTNT